jgi:hypothetical protein
MSGGVTNIIIQNIKIEELSTCPTTTTLDP